ncbi:peptidylprolyl isomerase [Thiorhodococcus mannitoliphagus]|uniref:Peptidyl-prolyl cis-trans isomerase n=1 Tax=Thiorhodococcus mannitoliphagus TaxID=329406 RepID=A0A6P1DXE9_9GAMM|nr:peptidylprolyl isomerase [Thiorhodococcus mannitoliphagus]NEX22997.1 peptidylprolyl isomerase [Thiorhodococcus mannitoliphagus]
MSEAKLGDTVKIHYTGTLEDGTVFDSTNGSDPIEFTIGDGGIIPGFETAVQGMTPGGTKTVTIAPEQAYGHYNEEMTQQVPRSAIPDDIELREGMILSAESPDGLPISFTVKAFDAAQVTIDGNHPLAGRNLTFALELVAIS